ncbi:TonB-dependent receptor [Oleiharenicola lentus]|uniref:TonB-dependent receptor n=1 Tax=Oleiharenicola lentus TaxID=2508720 RepID=UPI003F6719EA
MKNFPILSLCLATFAASPLAATLDDGAPTGATVHLDDYLVIADKEKLFSLPLDAAPATGSRLALTNRDLPASVSIITQEVMQLRGFRTAVEAVEGAVGMTGGTQFGSIPGFATRGFTGNSVTVLRDGIRQNTASQSARTVDAFNLDRVEILKGPASLLFGEGAIGGAVNYISKSPDRVARGEVFASYGAWNNTRLGLGYGGPLVKDKFFFRADVSHTERDGFVERNHQRYTGFSGALGWDVALALKLTLSTTYLEDWNESYYGNPVIYDAVDRYDPVTGTTTRLVAKANSATDSLVNSRVDPAARRTNYNILDNYAETENSFHRLRAEWTPASEWTIANETYVTTQVLRWRNLESNLWNPVTQLVERSAFTHIYRDDLLTGNRLDVTHKGELFGRTNRFVIGGFVEHNDLTRGGTPAGYATTLSSVTLLNPDVGVGPGDGARFQKTSNVFIDTAALYLENALDVTASLKLVVGLRRDFIALSRRTLVTPSNPTAITFNKDYSPTTGRAGLVWSATKHVNLYASYSRAAEPVTQLVSLNTAQNDFALQTGRQFEAGAKGSFAEGKIDFTVALYDIEKNNLLSSTLDPLTGLRISQQIGAQVSQGTEIAVAYLPTRDWRFEANFAWTWTAEFKDFRENLGTGVISRDGNRPANVPEIVANAYVSKTFGKHWRIGGGPRYVGERTANNANLIWTPAYTTLDASLSYALARWSVTLRGRNLLDKNYEEWATGLMQRLADPRSAEVSARYRF